MDWDLVETLGKVRASPEDIITKAKYPQPEVLYSKDGEFPVLDCDERPPAHLEWQKTPLHGLVICGEKHLIQAVQDVVQRGSEHYNTFNNAKIQVQGEKYSKSKASIWTARTALFLIRLFATTIG